MGPPAAGATTAAGAAAEVAAAIAQRWGTDARSIVVEMISPSPWPAAGTPFRLTGSGDDGRWAVWFEESGSARQLLVHAGVRTAVVTAATDLERGVMLEAAHLSSVTGVRWGAPSAGDPPVEPGWITRRRIAKGEPIRRPAAEPPRAVRPGDDVRIEVVHGAITLSLEGRAAGSAAIGETVAVRAQTGKRLEGTVITAGLVRVVTVREEP